MTWIPTDGTMFPGHALPYGSFVHDGRRRLGVAVGNHILDLLECSESGLFDDDLIPVLETGRLNELLATNRETWTRVRERVVELVTDGRKQAAVGSCLVDQSEVTMAMAWDVADYVDFYSSRQHAENLGRLFRPDAPPLLENWLWLPVAYHGRAGTVVVTDTPISRPSGQMRDPGGGARFGPSERLDIELELGFVVGGPTQLGQSVTTHEAADHLFGVVLLNDWSARDIQAWEYVPLGPNLGKSFATSVSAWVLPVEALADARVMHPEQSDPVPLPYLRSAEPWALDLDLEVFIRPAGSADAHRVAAVNAADSLYWTADQQLAHMTVNGASIRAGDLFGTGTISGNQPGEYGSLIELTKNGAEPILVGSSPRTFLHDGDTVILRGSAATIAGPVHLGEVVGTIVGKSPAG